MRARTTPTQLRRVAQARAASVANRRQLLAEALTQLRAEELATQSAEAATTAAYQDWNEALNTAPLDPLRIASHHSQVRICARAAEDAARERDKARAQRDECAEALAVERAHEAANLETMRLVVRAEQRHLDEKRQRDTETHVSLRRGNRD